MRLGILLTTLASATLLAGCGGSGTNPFDAEPSASATADPAAVKAANAFAGQSALEIDQAGDRAGARLRSVHYVADVTSKGMRQQLDLVLDRRGNCKGSVTGPQGTGEVLGTKGTYWTKPDAKLLASQVPDGNPSVANLLRGKWIVAPALATTCDLAKLVAGSTPTAAQVRKAGRAKIAGQDTVKVVVTLAGGTATEFVRTSAPHYAVRAELKGATTGTVVLSGFDQPVVVQAPPSKQVVDPSNAGG